MIHIQEIRFNSLNNWKLCNLIGNVKYIRTNTYLEYFEYKYIFFLFLWNIFDTCGVVFCPFFYYLMCGLLSYIPGVDTDTKQHHRAILRRVTIWWVGIRHSQQDKKCWWRSVVGWLHQWQFFPSCSNTHSKYTWCHQINGMRVWELSK